MTLPNIEAKPAPEPLRHPEKAARPDQPSPRKPPWIRVKAPTSPQYHATRRLMRDLKLNTVCEEAACPNIGECWKEKHATILRSDEHTAGLQPHSENVCRLLLEKKNDKKAEPDRGVDTAAAAAANF